LLKIGRNVVPSLPRRPKGLQCEGGLLPIEAFAPLNLEPVFQFGGLVAAAVMVSDGVRLPDTGRALGEGLSEEALAVAEGVLARWDMRARAGRDALRKCVNSKEFPELV
jgi:hypothetical protein